MATQTLPVAAASDLTYGTHIDVCKGKNEYQDGDIDTSWEAGSDLTLGTHIMGCSGRKQEATEYTTDTLIKSMGVLRWRYQHGWFWRKQEVIQFILCT